jgi:hypothetical protein
MPAQFRRLRPAGIRRHGRARWRSSNRVKTRLPCIERAVRRAPCNKNRRFSFTAPKDCSRNGDWPSPAFCNARGSILFRLHGAQRAKRGQSPAGRTLVLAHALRCLHCENPDHGEIRMMETMATQFSIIWNDGLSAQHGFRGTILRAERPCTGRRDDTTRSREPPSGSLCLAASARPESLRRCTPFFFERFRRAAMRASVALRYRRRGILRREYRHLRTATG